MLTDDHLLTFVSHNGEYYLPPVPKEALARLLRANAHHGAIPGFKRNLILSRVQPSEGLSWLDMHRAALDFVVFGGCYFYVQRDLGGRFLGLTHMMAMNMRVRVKGGFRQLEANSEYQDFDESEVLQILDYGVKQDIYGVPD